MDRDLEMARAFGTLLRQDASASSFYDGCTRQEQRAMLLYLTSLHSMEEIQQFVHRLSGAKK